MPESKVFHKSVRGASHVNNGKPCQDYSISIEEDGIQIVVVCDGHGSETYVRSDKGAQLAAEITAQMLTFFAQRGAGKLFQGESFSITAKPNKNPFIDIDGHKMKYEDLDESQQRLARQAKLYFESESRCVEQQKVVNELLGKIIEEWKSNIRIDEEKVPFNKKELAALNGLPIEKAYGCTLLAFMRTTTYWIAFQIGDGSIYCCDNKLSWKKPVPDDCACFLNYTTSLCDSNPLAEFRYAFCGNGDMPVAVFVCSDGVDGSLRIRENIQDFYEQIIGLYIDGDDVIKELDEYLPSMSEHGNKDDVSVAGIVNVPDWSREELVRVMGIKKREREISSEYRAKKGEIEKLSAKIDTLEAKQDRQKDAYFMKKTDLDERRRELEVLEKEVDGLEKLIESSKKDIRELRELLKGKKDALTDWKFTIKNEMAELESEQIEIEDIGDKPIDMIDNW